MDRDVTSLQSENQRLRVLADEDWLTGLYNRRTLEVLVNEALARPGGGMLLMLDIDRFKQVNDRYGHLIGDSLLREAASAIREMFSPRDIVGRVAGDAFAVYILGGCTPDAVKSRLERLQERLQQAGRQYGTQCRVTFTHGWAEKEEKDTFESLYDRADRMLRAEKNRLNERRAQPQQYDGMHSVCTDMAFIRRELREKDPPQGAFCQDYETFKQIYRFVERGLKRSGQSAFIILMTLSDAQGNFIPLGVRTEYMNELAQDLHASLRRGDLFAPYSDCQYLLMVLGASDQNAEKIGKRIHTRFLGRFGAGKEPMLRYDIYPMGELPPNLTEDFKEKAEKN